MTSLFNVGPLKRVLMVIKARQTLLFVCICDDEKNAHVIANLLNMNEIRASLP